MIKYNHGSSNTLYFNANILDSSSGNFGVFDIFAFGFKQLGSMLFAKNPIRDGNFVDYKQEKAEKRSDSSYGFVAVVAAGLVFAIALVILDIVYFISM